MMGWCVLRRVEKGWTSGYRDKRGIEPGGDWMNVKTLERLSYKGRESRILGGGYGSVDLELASQRKETAR